MKTDQSDNRPKVEAIKEFNVSSRKVFDAWLDTEMLSRWMFGPDVRDEEIVRLTNDPKKGGTFSYVVRRDGEELDHKGTYREIDRPNRLVFTWGVNEEAGDESVVTIEIEPTDNGCRLTLTHELDPRWKEYTERTKRGWSTMLNKLKKILQ